MDIAERINELLKLPHAERAEIAFALFDSLGTPGQPLAPGESWEDAWAPEINRRLDRLDAGIAQTIPMEDVLGRLEENARGPNDAEVAAAALLLHRVRGLDEVLLVPAGAAEPLALSGAALRAFVHVLAHLTNGDGVAVVRVPPGFIAERAAEVMQVFRPQAASL